MFDFCTSKKRFDANKVEVLPNGKFPYIVRTALNNGQKGYIDENEIYLNEANTISFGQDTATMFYQEKPYFTGDKIKIVKAKDERFNKKNANFFITVMAKAFSSFSWGSSSFNVTILENQKIQLPVKNGQIDFDFMEGFTAELEAERTAELEAERTAELEAERTAELEAYLEACGLQDYTLTAAEEQALSNFEKSNWGLFNLEKLFGKATRGRRLKSEDRVSGTLPFVTAGETDEGVSAFIANDVIVFSENTTTIDMFGSAKYRNYKYGADDHIAVVHTEHLAKFAAIFVTTAIHKTSYAGQFSYSRNFYAKDADELNVSLPVMGGQPNYEFMENFISAIQKLVIKDVVLYADKKIASTKEIIQK